MKNKWKSKNIKKHQDDMTYSVVDNIDSIKRLSNKNKTLDIIHDPITNSSFVNVRNAIKNTMLDIHDVR